MDQMNRPDISTATALTTLREVLEEDIRILTAASVGDKFSAQEHSLLKSLASAKAKMIENIPENVAGIGQSAAPASKRPLRGYGRDDFEQHGGNEGIVFKLYSVEEEQADFLRRTLTGKGVPDDIHKILDNAGQIANRITSQLERIKMTSQINDIVL